MKRDRRVVRLGLVLALALALLAIAQTPLSLQSSAGSPNQYKIFLPVAGRAHRPTEMIFATRMQHVSDSYGLHDALEAGIRSVRAVTFSWAQIEAVRTSPPTYVWTSVDWPSIETAAANGIELVGTIHYTPSWAQARPGYGCGPIKPEELDAFADFLQALVSKFGRSPYKVHHWSIWNEPDVHYGDVDPNSGFGCWGDNALPDYGGSAYGQMLQVAYQAIKEVAPNAEVIAGELLLNDPVGLASKFTEGILQGGGGPYFDTLSFHAYSYYYNSLGLYGNLNWPGAMTALPEKTQFLRSVLDQYGFPDKPIMATEASMTMKSNNPTWEFLETQAMYIPRAYAEGKALGLKKIVYYSMTDDWPGRNNGLLKSDLSRKPSYHAYRTALSFMSGAYYLGDASNYPAGIGGYSFFSPTGKHLDVIWSVDGTPQSVTVPPGGEAYDRYGVSLGSGTVEVGYSPLYVLRP